MMVIADRAQTMIALVPILAQAIVQAARDVIRQAVRDVILLVAVIPRAALGHQIAVTPQRIPEAAQIPQVVHLVGQVVEESLQTVLAILLERLILAGLLTLLEVAAVVEVVEINS